MIPYPTTRDHLLARIRDFADHEAWLEFERLYRPAIYRLGRIRGLREADAQDLVQSVLVAVANKIDSWHADPARAKFRTWLARVATNQAITILRQRRPDEAQGGTSVQIRLREQPQQDEVTEELRRQSQREVFRMAARRVREEFEEPTWQAFWQTTIESRSVAEVAETLSRTAGAIYTARSRVMHRLAEVVREIQRDE